MVNFTPEAETAIDQVAIQKRDMAVQAMSVVNNKLIDLPISITEREQLTVHIYEAYKLVEDWAAEATHAAVLKQVAKIGRDLGQG